MKASQFAAMKRANSAKIGTQELPNKGIVDINSKQAVNNPLQNNLMNATMKTNIPRQMSAVSSMKQLPSLGPINSLKMPYINNADPISVNPSQVIFKDIKSNQTYETFVIVQSLSRVLKRIKIIQPKTVRFRVDYDMAGKIAAGLSMKLLVTFEAGVLDDFHDKFVVQYEKEGQKCEIEVPLHALRPQPTVIFEPFLNFGFVRLFDPTTKMITFKNEGEIAGKVRLKFDHLPEITCDPPFFSVLPKQESQVKIVFNSKESGIFRGKIEVINEGQSLQKFIDVNATSVEFNKFFIDDQGTSVTTFDFGETYFGQKKVIKGYLVNNSPTDQNFKVNMRIGFHSSSEEKVTLQTPIEVGIEQTEQIMKCIPERGFVKAYSQIAIQFVCHSKVRFEHEVITKNYALSDQDLIKRKEAEEDYTYSAIFEFLSVTNSDSQHLDHKDTVPVTLIGHGLCPKIKISKALLNFGECSVHDHRDSLFYAENKYTLPVDLSIPRIPCFNVDPPTCTLQAGVKSSLVATFLPSTVGKFKTFINITLINGQYKIPIQVIGESNTFLDSKLPKTRGTESLPIDFKLHQNFIDENQQIKTTKNMLQTMTKTQKQQQYQSLSGGMNESSSIIVLPKGIDEMEINLAKLEELRTIQNNKNKYTDMIRDNRTSRVLKEKDKIVKLRLEQMESKLKEKGLTLFQDDGDDDDKDEKDPRKTVPLDIEFELGMMDTHVVPPTENLLSARDPLFVSKPIGKYEPQREEIAKFFHPDPNVLMRKPFPEVAKTHKDIRDVRMELTGEMLQKINIGPKIIDFGAVYVESKMVKCFCIKNDLRSSIKVQLSTLAPELSGTFQKSQIIPSSETGRFDVQLYSTNLNDNYEQTVKYTINDRHQFEFQVKAKIEKVKLDLSKTSLKFQFSDESTNMETFEVLKITNVGNADGKYKWDTTSKAFLIHPSSGVVPSGGSVETVITYRPTAVVGGKENQAGGLRQESDKLVMTVTNGIEQSVKCEGFVYEAKCFIRQQSIELGQIIVSKEETRVFQIKNTSRIAAIFRVLTEKLPENCLISPVVGKILPDGIQECQVKYQCREEREINTEIQVLIRGGKILKLPFSVSTIIPQVIIKEDVFNFGQLTKDNSGHLEMTLLNQSKIPAELLLDMRTEEENPDCPDGIGCLTITPLDEGDESVLKSVHEDFVEEEDDEDGKKQDGSGLDIDPDDQSIQSDDSNMSTAINKKYTIIIKGEQALRFQLTFTPNDAKPYNFELPLTLARFGQLTGLLRNILCRGIKSQFLVQPQNIEFTRKIITTSDKDYPENFELTLSNPERKPVSWRIDDSPFEKLKKLFSIHPTSGRIEPGQNQLVKASFNPKEAGEYEESINIFIDGEEGRSSTPVHTIQVKGVAAYPKLLFERREILLPVVPLGVESKCVFRIINDGYENLKIRHEILQEIKNINIDCRFPEGKSLNVSKNKLRVEVFFKANKPVSFTVNIEFKDERNKGYIISVSGTSDNSLLTIFPYLQRCKGDYHTQINPDNNCLMLLEDDVADDQSDTTQNNGTSNGTAKKKYTASVASAKTHSSRASARSTKSALGYSPVPKEMLESSKEQIKNWLNFNVLSNNIQTFPESVVEDNGDQLYELLMFLVGNRGPLLDTKASIEGTVQSRSERAILLFNQYDSLIRLLKQDGALLNHIRPQHLLGYNEFNAYIKSLPKEQLALTHPSGLKISLHRYSYFQADAWITLFYQILKIYYLSRISFKILKQIPNINPEKATLPDYYLNGSNIYSQFEGILLRWLELNNDIISPHQSTRITSFDKELASGHLIANLVKNYLGIEQTAHLFSSMKPVTNNDDDNFFNCTKVHNALQEINLQTPFSAIDLSKASQRETVLFLIQIFNALPNYIPKGPSIVFSCVLGEEVTKTIELSNPSAKPIHYWVKYSGSPDFQIESDQIKLEPKQTYKFKVKFISRVSIPVTGRIRFTNKRDSNVAAAALVFDFKSLITGRISQKVHEIDSPLYQKKEFQIKVENKFLNSTHGEFSVTIVHEFETKEKPDDSKKKVTKEKGQQKNILTAVQIKKEKDELAPLEVLNAVPCFFIKQTDTMVIKRGSYSMLNLIFIPIVLENARCFVIFSDPSVGEFQHEILATVTMPEEIISIPENPITPPIYVDEQRNWPLKIPFKNEALRDARKNIESLLAQRKKKDFDPKKYTLPNQQPELINFYIELDQPNHNFIAAPKTFSIDNPLRASKKKIDTSKLDQSVDSKKIDGLSMISSISPLNPQKSIIGTNQNDSIQEVDLVDKNSMFLMFNFKIPCREYTCNIILKNPEKCDIRRYKLVVASLPKPIKASLEMMVAAREFIIQDIPIMNPSDKDWVIKLALMPNEEMNGKYFFIGPKPMLVSEQPTKVATTIAAAAPSNLLYVSQRDTVIKKKQTGIVSIGFAPLWICQCEAKLVMTNPSTNEVFEYELKGIGEEPLAVDHLIINCQARASTKQDLVLRNPFTDRSITYEVETDLVGASGPPTLTIGPGKKSTYSLNITPLLSGQYTGSITFTDVQTGEYTWWTALLNTESPPSQKKIDMITTLRKAVVFDIEINNPSAESTTFEVFIEGDGLIGIPYMQIPPKSSQIYELFFLPLKVSRQQGSIAFVSEHLGEIWYELNLVAEDSQMVRLPMLKAELGKVEQHEVRLDNPSNEDVRVWVSVSNPANFDVMPEEIIIPAHEEISAYIRYMPSVLDQTQTTDVRFETDSIGRWEYLAFGMGVPPTQFEPKIVTIGLNKDFSSVILFKNPFKDPIQVNVLLEGDDESVKDVLQLLTKKQGKEEHITVPGQGVFQIPFSFTPREIRCYTSTIIVSMNDKIQWRYPIKAITESYSTGILATFKSKCRVISEEEFKVPLPGITEIFGEEDTFDFEIKNIPPKFESVISKSFMVRMLQNRLTNKNGYLLFSARFNPMKPFKTTIDFVIHRKLGGLWKFKIILESSPPNEDDVIVLSSPLDAIDTVSFRLTNRFKTFATYSAKFTSESDPEFSVSPTTGLLEPYGRDGTIFSISFQPIEYGKAKTGKLIIETDDMFWSYLIKGVLPKYEPPMVGVSKINNKLGEEVTQNWKRSKRNFLCDNIRKTNNTIKDKTMMSKGGNDSLALMSKTLGSNGFLKKAFLTPQDRQSILDGKSVVSNKNSKNTNNNLSVTSNRFFKNN